MEFDGHARSLLYRKSRSLTEIRRKVMKKMAGAGPRRVLRLGPRRASRRRAPPGDAHRRAAARVRAGQLGAGCAWALDKYGSFFTSTPAFESSLYDVAKF